MADDQNLTKLNIKITEEKQPIEKFFNNFKIAFFDLNYLLIKHQEENYLIHIIIIIIQFLEIIAFPFSPYFTNYWNNTYYIILSDFFQYFQLIHLWKGNTAFYIIAYIIISILTVTFITLLIYVMVKLAKFKLKVKWPIKLLYFFFTTESLIILPVGKIFISVFNCQNGVVYYAEGIKAFQGTHIAMMIISIILLLVLSFFSVLVHLIFFEFRNKNQNINGKLTSRTDIELLIAKGILLIMYEFLYENKEILICVTLVLSLYLYWEYLTYEPYFDEIINMLNIIMYFLFFLASAIPFISLVLLSFTQYNGSLPLFLLCCPLIIGGQWIMKRRRIEMNYLLMPLSKISNGYIALKQIKYFLSLIRKQEFDTFHKEHLFVEGYIKHYEQSCCDSNCSLKKYLNTPWSNYKDSKIFLYQHGELLYKNAISRFPLDAKLRLSFGNFIYEQFNKKQKALLEISNAEKYRPNFEEEFFIYKCKKIIDEEVEVNVLDDNIDYVSAIAYKGYMNTFKTFINKVGLLYIEFWQLLLMNDESKAENFTKMSELGNKINKCVEEINQNLNKMEKINPNDPDIYKIYSQFLSDVQNDQHKALIYNSKLNDSEDNKHKYDENNLLNLNFQALAKSEEYKYIVASAQNDNFGCITNLSLNILTMFGFSKTDLIGQTLDMIMPEIFQLEHRKLLLEKYNASKQIGIVHKGNSSNNNNGNLEPLNHDINRLKEVSTYGRNKTKYLIPIKLKAGIATTEDGEYYFVTKVFNDIHNSRDEYHSQQCIILTDTDLVIQNFTANSVKLLNMNSYNMNNSIEITGFIKEFREELLKLAMSNDDQSTPGKSKQMKRHAISKKFRYPTEITWYMGENLTPSINLMGSSFRYITTKNNRKESTESFNVLSEELLKPASKLTGKLAPYNTSYITKKLFLFVEDVNILSKHVGYSFKFDISNQYTQAKYKGTSNNLLTSIKLISQKFENGTNIHQPDNTSGITNGHPNSPLVKSSNPTSSFGSNNHYNLIKDQNTVVGGTSIVNSHLTNDFVPELGTQFNIDVRELAFKQQNSDENMNIREEIKQMAKNKIQLGTTIMSNTNFSDSNERSNDTSSYNYKSESDEDSSDPESKSNNNIYGSQVLTHTEPIKKNQVNDSYYHVNLTPIILFMYNYGKGGVTKIENSGISQVEFRLKEKDDVDPDESSSLPESKDKKDKREVMNQQGVNKPKEESANISESSILIQQIKQALNNKELQPTIINLAIFTFFVFCILIASVLILLFYFINIRKTIDNDFGLTMRSFSFHQAVIYSIFNVRELVLLSTGKYTNIYDKDVDRYIKNQTTEALEYFSANSDSLSNISTVLSALSQKSQEELDNIKAVIDILSKDLKIKTYTLPIYAAFIELNYALFHTTRLRFQDIKPLNENVFYYLRNSINNSLLNSQKQINIFLTEFLDTTGKYKDLVYILIAVCFVMYLIAYFIFSYFYEAVERRKESYLAVFYEIGKGFIIISLNKCEKFCQRIQIEHDRESRNISLNSSFYSSVNNDITASINQSSSASIDISQGRKSKRNESQNKINKMKGLFVLCVFKAYLFSIFILIINCLNVFNNYISFAYYFCSYQNEYILIFITLRELIFDPNSSYAFNTPIKTYIEDVFYSFYSKGEKNIDKVNEYLRYTPSEFKNFYFEMKNGNLCKYANDFNEEFNISNLSDAKFCASFFSNSTSLGLDSVLSYYIEEIRLVKNIVINYEDFNSGLFYYNHTLINSGYEKVITGKDKDELAQYLIYDSFHLFNTDLHKNLLIFHKFILKKIFSNLAGTLVVSLKKAFTKNSLAIFIAVYCLIGIMTIAYLSIWIPFQMNLNETIFKTKNMLSIIPKEVLASLKNIKNMLNIDKSSSHEKKKK